MSVEPSYDERGLVPCIVQDAATGTVLMLAWMNAEALELTRATHEVHFWSRSRQSLWKKGETSGNTLAVVELRIDCDRDAVLVRARPAGPTCHTGATSCFFTLDDATTDDGVPIVNVNVNVNVTDPDDPLPVPPDPDDLLPVPPDPDDLLPVPPDPDDLLPVPPDPDDLLPVPPDPDDPLPVPPDPDGPTVPAAALSVATPAEILPRLEQILIARRDAPPGASSYTRSLLDAGMPKILAKIAEEHGELAAELPAGGEPEVVHETADLIFHVMVGLVARGIPLDRVLGELARRFGTSGHVEKASRT